MLALALAFGFSGYLLPWNELSYYATLVGTEVPAVVPGVGGFAVHFLRGGEQVTGAAITRFFAAHTVILPLMFGALLAIHLILIQFQGQGLPLGMPPHKVRDPRPFFSEFLLIDGCIWLLLLGAIATLAVFLPAEVGEKAGVLKPAVAGHQTRVVFPLHVQDAESRARGDGCGPVRPGCVVLSRRSLSGPQCPAGAQAPGLTGLFAAAIMYVATFEILAWIEPGVTRAPETLSADTYSLSRGIVSLLLLWGVIMFLWLISGSCCGRTPGSGSSTPKRKRTVTNWKARGARENPRIQAKQILREAGVAVPRGCAADTPQAAADAFSNLGGKTAVLKAQIHAGGRGKGTVGELPANTASKRCIAGRKPKGPPETCWATGWSPSKPGRREKPFTTSWSKKVVPSPANSTSRR